MAYRLLYAGFDGLDVAFQGHLSNHMLGVLADARAEAEDLGGAVPREVDGLRFRVLPRGAPEGFRYLLDTGDDGEIWKVKHNSDLTQWNLFASARSFALLTHHYAGVKRRLFERLDRFEATVAAARPNRVDVACDLDAPGFEPKPDCFVAPARTRARSYHPGEGARDGDRVEVHWLAGCASGVMIGRMPGRQHCLYDKRMDSLVKRKHYWAEVWGLDLAKHRSPVWRVEARAARAELRERWGVRSFADLEGRLAAIVGSGLAKVRYVVPSLDTNASRWPTHPLWETARSCILQAIEAHVFTPAPPRRDLTTPRRLKIREFERQLVGLAVSYGGLVGLDADQVGDLPARVAALIRDYAREHPDTLEEKLGRARARYGP